MTALHPAIRVLFISGYAGERLGHPSHGKDLAELLQKPFTPEVLVQRVRRILDAA